MVDLYPPAPKTTLITAIDGGYYYRSCPPREGLRKRDNLNEFTVWRQLQMATENSSIVWAYKYIANITDVLLLGLYRQ
jgi:hypothetical protein